MKRLLAFILCAALLTVGSPPSFTASAAEGNNDESNLIEYPDTVYEDDGDYSGDSIYVPDADIPLAYLLFWEGDTDAVYNEDTDEATLNAIIDALLSEKYTLHELIIKFKDPSQIDDKNQLRREIAKMNPIDYIAALDVYVVKVEDIAGNPELSLKQYIKKLVRNIYIEYVEPNYTVNCDLVPNDPNYKSQSLTLTVLKAQDGWGIIDKEVGWDKVGKSGPVVAVVDTGVAIHPDLPALLSGYSAVAGLSPNNDKENHGTGVAGTLGALGNNGLGGVGINWNAKILPVKVDDATGSITVANLAKGITWAADNGARVISISVSTKTDSVTLKNAIDYAYKAGCAIFASAGNDGKNGLNYPARYSNVVACGASASGSSLASVSNYGTGMGVLAISSYNTTTAAGGYASLSGTSFSTPQVSGLASLVLTLNPDLTNDEVYSYIQQGAKTLNGGYNEQTGYGFIDISNTLSLVRDGMVPKKDVTPPVLTLKGDQTITLKQGEAYIEPGYTAIDNVDGDITNKVVTTGTVNVNVPGTYTLTYTISDAAGNKSTAARAVQVIMVDITPPSLMLKGSQEITLKQGETYTEPGYTAIDNVDGDITNKVVTTGTVNVNVPGTYTLTYTSTDAAGNTSSATRTIRVIFVDTTPPTLTLRGSQTMQMNQGENFVDPGYTAIDNVDGDITNKVTVAGTVNTNTPGIYTLTYKVSDMAGNTSSATRKVEVMVVIPPTINISLDAKSFIIEAAIGSRNNYEGSVGYEFKCLADMTVSYVGRPLNGAMNDSHIVYIWDVSTMKLLASGEVKPGSPIDAAGFKVVKLDKEIVLKAGSHYRIVSAEKRGGDRWYDVEQAYNLIPTADCLITTPVYTNEWAPGSYPGNVWNPGGTKGYTGVTFYYELNTPQYFQPPAITLNGQQEVRINYGESYNDAGYSAVDCFGKDITASVSVTNNIEIFLAGVYTVTYEVTDAGGNSAKAIRTVFVTEQEIERAPKGSPNISIIGSDPIILNIGGTAYREQGARANDFDGTNISDRVKVIGAPDTTKAGTYTVTYKVVNDDEMEATTTREVRILAPTEVRSGRTPYGFSGQAKEGQKVTHTGIVSGSPGFMDLSVRNIDKNMTITVQLLDSATKQAVMKDTFTAIGKKQYSIGSGRHELVVIVDQASGNSKYSIDLLMPEEVIFVEEEEVPLAGLGDLFTDVRENAWYRDAIEYIAARGFVIGIDGDKFEPNASLSLGLFITTTMKAYGIEPKPDMFDKTGEGASPYAVYLEAAKLLGIINDEGGALHPDSRLTREEMFALLYRLLVVVGETPGKAGDGKTLSDFTDSDLISGVYLEEVTALIEAGIISGVRNGLLAPGKTATRAEMSSIIYRLFKA